MRKIKVFVAHSFDETISESKIKSDEDVAKWFTTLMRKKPLNFDVVTGKKPIPGKIGEKIETNIADSDSVVGIFTRRYKADDRWFPSSFILCECAYSLGIYHNSRKIFCGFYEDGIDPKDLALITIGGLELIKFNRERLNDDRAIFVEYLETLKKLITQGSYKSGQFLLEPQTYNQEYLKKIYTIYRNGTVIVQNINNMVIKDAEKFNNGVNKGRIPHEIWLQRSIPPFKEMIKTPIEERREKAFFNGICRYNNMKKIGTPLSIDLEKEEGNSTSFYVGFKDEDGTQLKLKDNDIILYQYAWGVPNAYSKFEEDLPLPSVDRDGQINENAYNQAEVVSNHGEITNLEIELRFERCEGPFLSKSPFWQYAKFQRHLRKWDPPKTMPLVEQDMEEEDHAMWFQTYRLKQKNFQGSIRILWRPSSKRHCESIK